MTWQRFKSVTYIAAVRMFARVLVKKQGSEVDFTATIWVICQVIVHKEPELAPPHQREHD